MAAPTTRFRLIPQSTLASALDTAAKRIAAISGQQLVSTGVGNEVDFGIVDISSGAADSAVRTLLWDVTANGGNTQVDGFKLWASSLGFVQAATVVKLKGLCGADQVTPVNTQQYVANATPASYTFANMLEVEPGAQNVWPSDEGVSMDVSGGASDDAIMWAMHLAIAAGETTGTYKGTDANRELQFSFKFAYS
jgi:hypothetical protein